MNRYGIFVFYDAEGIVGSYVLELLNSLKHILKKLVIIINGEIQEEEKIKFNIFTKHIFQRKNIGYDGGAYKDAFLHFLKFETWEDYDEIFLINDTFYGPLWSWDKFINIMENNNFDFWGLIRQPSAKGIYYAGTEVVEHIKSYFICITKTIFMSSHFLTFWKQMEYPKTYIEAVAKFEIIFSKYLVEKGFKMGSLRDVLIDKFAIKTDLQKIDMAVLITKLHFPVLKRKFISLENYLDLKNIFSYLENDVDYPIEIIKEDVNRRIRKGVFKPFCPIKLLEFCQKFKMIYLYGKGKYALNIKAYLEDQGFQIEGYIVSNITKHEQNVYGIDEFILPKDAGIVVALGRENTYDVCGLLKTKFETCQILFPQYD